MTEEPKRKGRGPEKALKGRHNWVKELGVKGAVAELLDGLTDRVTKQIDNTNVRDWVYVLSYVSATYLAYSVITNIKPAFNIWLDSMIKFFGTPFYGLIPGIPGLKDIIKQPAEPTEEPFVLDKPALITSFVVAYMVLKLDLGDVASAVDKVKGSIMALGVVK